MSEEEKKETLKKIDENIKENPDNSYYKLVKEYLVTKKDISKTTPQKKETFKWESFKNYYNSLGLKQIKILTPKRKVLVNKMLKEFDKQTIIKVLEIAQKTPFLNGENKRGWKADFDFIFKSDKFIKILEGSYQNEKNNTEYAFLDKYKD